MIKVLLKTILLTFLVVLIHITKFPLDQEVVVSLNTINISLNLLFVELLAIILIMLIIKFANIINYLLNIPQHIKSKINSINIDNQFLFLKDALVYNHFKCKEEAINEVNKISDPELKLLLWKIFDPENNSIQGIENYDKTKILLYPEAIELSLKNNEIETAEELVKIKQLPKLSQIFKQIINRFQAVSEISNNNYLKAIKLLEQNLKLKPQKLDLTLYLNSILSINKKSKVTNIIKEYWSKAPSYEAFCILVKNFEVESTYEEKIKQIRDYFALQTENFYWRYYLNLYLLQHGQIKLIDNEIVSQHLNEKHHEKLMIYFQIYFNLEKHDLQKAKSLCQKLIDYDIS